LLPAAFAYLKKRQRKEIDLEEEEEEEEEEKEEEERSFPDFANIQVWAGAQCAASE